MLLVTVTPTIKYIPPDLIKYVLLDNITSYL